MEKFRIPLKVSPTIKFTRWTLLLAGVIYGVNKQAFYKAYDRNKKIQREEIIKKMHEEAAKHSREDLTNTIRHIGHQADLDDLKTFTYEG